MRALVNHPEVGSVWLDNARIEDGFVVGEAWDHSDMGSPYLPDDYTGQRVTLHFPKSCIRKQVDE